MAQALLSDDDFGLPTRGTAPSSPPAPAATSTNDNAAPASFNGLPVLNIGRKASPATAPQPSEKAAASPATGSAPTLLSDADFGVGPPPNAGPLTNTSNEDFWSGLGKGAATATIKGVADIPGQVGNTQSLADYLIDRARSALTGESMADIQASNAKFRQDVQQTNEAVNKPLGVSLPNTPIDRLPTGEQIAAPVLRQTGEYVPGPDNEAGRMAMTGLETAIGALGPGLLTSAPRAAVKTAIKAAPGTFTAGGVGQGVTDVTGDPLLGMAAGAVAPAAVEVPAKVAAATVRPFKEDLPLVGIPFAGTREKMAGEDLLNRATDPAAVRKTLAVGDAAPDETSTPVVPGSRPTTAALTNDPGLLHMEREARTNNQMPFNARAAEQNTAQRAAIERMSPQGADTMRPAQRFEARLRDLDAATGHAEETLTAHAQAEAGKLGNRADAEHVGSVWRSAAEVAKGAAKGLRRKLYNAIDPDDKLNIVATPLRDRGEALASDIDPLGDQLEGKEKQIFDKVRALPDVVKFNSLRALEDSITDAMSAERRTAGETKVWGRLSQLKSAVVDVRNSAIDNQVAHEQRMVDAGRMAAEDSLANRLDRSWEDELGQSSALEARSAPNGADTGRYAGEPVGEPAGEVPSSRRSGSATRDQGLPTASRGTEAGNPRQEQAAGRRLAIEAPARGSREQPLLEFLAQHGGLARNSDVSSALGGENPFFPGIGRVLRDDGMSADEALRAATDAGYLHDPGELAGAGERTLAPNDLLDLIEREASGDKQYRLGSNPDAWRNSTEGRRTESNVRATLKEFGIDPNKVDRRLLDQTTAMVHSGEESDPTVAFERAVMQDRDRFEEELNARQRDTGRIEGYDVQNDAGRTSPRRNAASGNEASGRESGASDRGIGANERASGLGDRAGGPQGDAQPALTPNIDEAAAGRVAAAKASHAEYARTFKEGPAAQALATNGFRDNYKLPAGAIPARAFVKGDRGYETVKAFVKAAGNDPGAIDALTDYALNPLRESLLPIGTVSPSKFARWQADYEPALRALNEARPGFSDRFSTAAKATEEMLQAGRTRTEALDEFQKSAAGQFLGKGGKSSPVEVENYVGDLLSAKDAPTRMRALVSEARFNPDIVAGLQKAGVDWMIRKFSTTAEAGTTGEKLLSGAGIIKFLKDQHEGLAELFPKEQLSNFAAVARDLERNGKWVTATGIKGSPGTAADLAAGMHKAAEGVKSHASVMGAILGGGFIGLEHYHTLKGAAMGAAGGGAAYLLGTLRSAGLEKKNALVRDALLHPERARQYMSRVPDRPNDQGLYFSLARQIRRQMIVGPVLVRQPQN